VDAVEAVARKLTGKQTHAPQVNARTSSLVTDAAPSAQSTEMDKLETKAQETAVTEQPFTFRWLQVQCEQHARRTGSTQTGTELAQVVLRTMRHPRGGTDMLEAELLDLLGFEDMNFLSALVVNHSSILAANPELATVPADAAQIGLPRSVSLQAGSHALAKETIPTLATDAKPTPQLVQFTVTTADEKQMMKEQRKLEKKTRKAAIRMC
jgi:hypothetical protein